jgi:hypothetical protein
MSERFSQETRDLPDVGIGRSLGAKNWYNSGDSCWQNVKGSARPKKSALPFYTRLGNLSRCLRVW